MRNAGLDILRLIAVFLVLGHHMMAPENSLLRHIVGIWHTGGWIGVDLFFVLSGFLVSGLLFTEYKHSAHLDVKRFLIRRGFKIYPPFWALLTVTTMFYVLHGAPIPQRALVGEMFFLQNYLGGLWIHTWSLAVEEHFYFGLAGLFWFVMIQRGNKDFRWIPGLFIGIGGTCLALRLAGWWIFPEYSYLRHLCGTHIRVDSLFYGVLLSYFYHFELDRLSFFTWSTVSLLAVGVLLLAPAFLFPLDHYWLVSAAGVSLFYLGSGFLVIAALRFTTVKSVVARFCATLGAASYSIYLWHMSVNWWGWEIIRRLTGMENWYVYVVWYLVGSCAIGYGAAYVIEAPVLFLRNRLYPSKGGAVSAPRHLSTSVTPVIRVIRELDELDKLRPLWNEPAAGSHSPMQAYAWIRACAETTLTAGDELSLLTVKTPSPTLAPLVRRRGKQTRLELLGVHEITEPMDFFYTTPAAPEPLTRAIVQLQMPLLFQRIPADSPVVTALQHAYRGRGLVLCRPMLGCPWISLDQSWLQPEQHLNAGRRSDLRRARRIAESLGPVRAEILSPTSAELPPLLEEALQVEAASWKGQERSAIMHDPVRGPFYRRYAALACEQGILRLCFLRLGDRVAAMQFAVEYGSAFWLLKIGYDEAFTRCSPGSLLLVETLRYAATHGLRSYEFLGTPAPWTRVWTPLERPCVSLWAYPAKIQGVTALAMDAATAARRRLSQVMQGWL